MLFFKDAEEVCFFESTSKLIQFRLFEFFGYFEKKHLEYFSILPRFKNKSFWRHDDVTSK